MPDHATKISELDDKLDAGAASVEVDGVKVAFNHKSIRQRRNELARADTEQKTKRPRVSTFNLRNG